MNSVLLHRGTVVQADYEKPMWASKRTVGMVLYASVFGAAFVLWSPVAKTRYVCNPRLTLVAFARRRRYSDIREYTWLDPGEVR